MYSMQISCSIDTIVVGFEASPSTFMSCEAARARSSDDRKIFRVFNLEMRWNHRIRAKTAKSPVL